MSTAKDLLPSLPVYPPPLEPYPSIPVNLRGPGRPFITWEELSSCIPVESSSTGPKGASPQSPLLSLSLFWASALAR